jgi:hypothetical protein
MTDPTDPVGDEHDPVLSPAGARLRADSRQISASSVEAGVWRRRARRTGVVAGVALAATAVLGGALVLDDDGGGDPTATSRPGGASPAEVEQILASLDDRPVDPTQVRLVGSVSTFADCDALIGELRQVGARHVGSRGFGDFGGYLPFTGGDDMARAEGYAADGAAMALPMTGPVANEAAGTTLGTNVQVEGVDELDFVKATGTLVYDLDGKGNLRITDVRERRVLSTLDVTPPAPGTDTGDGEGEGRIGPGWPGGDTQATELLVADGAVAVFGTEVEISEPVEGDPSATEAATQYLTVAFVDATDPAAPTVTDRVRIEGSLVSARLVGGEIRLVTTAHMADLGFVMPTTPNSVAKALDQNRRSVAGSAAADWIPDWQRRGEDPVPLVPCDRVHVPDTFAGVAMTSMVTFPIGAGQFEPVGTSILAPATTLYAGLDRVAISSEVWVDPIDRDRLRFDDWQTAIHEFRFTAEAPTYVGTGVVDGSTVGQFAFGEVGESLAVVTTEGTPWSQDPEVAVGLTLLTTDGGGSLAETAAVADLAEGRGAVTAVRFLDGRVLVSTGLFGREVHVLDVTDPAAPRRAGSVNVPGTVGYFHPLPDHRALVIGARYDEVGEGRDRRGRSWVQAKLLDVADPDAPAVLGEWERPWVSDAVGSDHHAFTWWPDRQLAMWGLYDDRSGLDQDRTNEAVVLRVDDSTTEVAVPPANRPPEAAPPCPPVEVTDPEARDLVGTDGVLLRCDDPERREVEWPRYQCYPVDDGIVNRFEPGAADSASFHLCSPAGPPAVLRVLVVDGTPILFTDQTLELLDPESFASTEVLYHPSGGGYWY